MSNKFDLFLLSNDYLDKHPRTWICVKGKKIGNIISRIEHDIINRNQTNREQISRLLARTLRCNHVSIKNILRGTRDYYPMPVILALCNETRKKDYYKKLIEKNIKYLKVNSASAKPIKASKELSSDLAKILGAFCADGSLSIQFVVSSKNKSLFKSLNLKENNVMWSHSRKEHYIAIQINKGNYKKISEWSNKNREFQVQTHHVVELTDGYKSNVESFNKWIYNEFGIKPTNYYDKGRFYRTIFSNKILARYLIEFFDMLPGPKVTTVDEPGIIKNASFNLRREFAKGALMFDGGVSKKKTLFFTSLSPYFANSIKEILTKDNIKVGSFKNKRGEYNLYTTLDNKINKLLPYFEKNTKKWNLLMWLSHKDFISNNINLEKDLIQTNEFLKLLKEIKICDANFLMNHLKLSHTTVRQHLLILKERGLIKLSNHPKILSNFVSENTTVFIKRSFHDFLFERILSKYRTYEEFASFLEVPKANLSAWKLKKNRIPLRLLKEVCLFLDSPFENVLEQVYETDREIAEII